ncbi:hypothetical protein WSM22_15470 [Cytophagales bacterium WSM2-2]|nr:hypothetical protein WSM22_15470 [Cytophagales bacterium WSM2-2]
MAAENNYQLGLLYLSHILISADGVINEHELNALAKVKEEEKISPAIFESFQKDLKTKKLSEIYQRGLAMVTDCSIEERKKIFVHLFRLCAADGNIHVKEVRLLLYSAKLTDSQLSEIVAEAEKAPIR